jgi:hypothetical protein
LRAVPVLPAAKYPGTTALVPVPESTFWASIVTSFPAVASEMTRCGASVCTGCRSPSESIVASTSVGGLYIPPLASVT